MKPDPAPERFNSRVELSAGNYTNIEAEAYTRQMMGNTRNSYSLGIIHQSSSGMILDNPLPTEFSRNSLQTGLYLYGREGQGQIELALGREQFHWYGFDRDRFTAETIPNPVVQQRYWSASLEGQLDS